MTQESLPFDTKIKNHNNEFKINGLFYKSEFITISEQNELINKIDDQPWLDDLRRRVQHFGYKYDYKARRINKSMKIADLPDWMMAYARKLHEEDIFPLPGSSRPWLSPAQQFQRWQPRHLPRHRLRKQRYLRPCHARWLSGHWRKSQ